MTTSLASADGLALVADFAVTHWPLSGEPAWAADVPRWDQMDAVSTGIADGWSSLYGAKAGCLAPDADAFVLASRAASGVADLAFARRGAFSPQRFVATLPSVILAPVMMMTGWRGPLFCVQQGESTLSRGLSEAAWLIKSGAARSVGVVNAVCETVPSGELVRARFLWLGKSGLTGRPA